MSWEKKPAIKSGGYACLCCGTPTQMFPMEGIVGVGFGYAAVTKDGEEEYREDTFYYEEGEEPEETIYWSGQDAERAALADPNHDWRIVKHAPLYSAVYQRHAPGQWVLIERDEGFA